jgi:hypothetical protein
MNNIIKFQKKILKSLIFILKTYSLNIEHKISIKKKKKTAFINLL